jgi:predicted Kef-type K+ transport protein
MITEWISAGGDISWILFAFVAGFIASRLSLPPLIGYLASGFVLAALGVEGGIMVEHLADIGVTLLLFSIGLKLKIKSLARPEIWLVTLVNTALIMAVVVSVLLFLAWLGMPLVRDLDTSSAAMVAFALSFSSTVFVVKVLEARGEVKSVHGGIAIGILVMQDVLAVVFLAFSAGYVPTVWALALLLLFPLRGCLQRLLDRVGHGELLLLLGFSLSLGGALLFESVGVKGDLGALIIGMMLANHSRAAEFAKSMLGFKDIFLVGFFLSVGLAGQFSMEALSVALILIPLLVVKAVLFFLLLVSFKLRARNALLASISLTNVSEFGLIVVSVCVSKGWLSADWLVVVAILLALSFLVMSPFNAHQNRLYQANADFWRRFQRQVKLPWDSAIDLMGMRVAIFGMGRVGSGAYQTMTEIYGDAVVGFDYDPDTVEKQQQLGRRVLVGNPADADFWEKVERYHHVELVMLATPNVDANIEAMELLRVSGYDGKVAAVAHFADEEERLKAAGVDTVFNIYAEAGSGFASQICGHLVLDERSV